MAKSQTRARPTFWGQDYCVSFNRTRLIGLYYKMQFTSVIACSTHTQEKKKKSIQYWISIGNELFSYVNDRCVIFIFMCLCGNVSTMVLACNGRLMCGVESTLFMGDFHLCVCGYVYITVVFVMLT